MGTHIKIGKCDIELVFHGDEFRGLGAVKIDGVTVRSSRRPMGVEIRNPNGIAVQSYKESARKETPEEFRLTCSMTQLAGGPMEFMLHTIRPRYNTADWTQGPEPLDGEFELILKPVSRTFGGVLYEGFSYQYSYHADSLPVYKILDRGTWEIGGESVGNEIWMRNGVVPSIAAIKNVSDVYSIEWFLPGIQQPNIFQFFPLHAALQGFTMTWHEKGALITWPSEFAHTRTLLEKHAGDDVIVHWHEHCGDLAQTFVTPPVEVLFAPTPKPTSHIARMNRWEDARAFIWNDLHKQIGLGYERVKPYGVMEEWEVPNLKHYREKGLPALAALGVETIMIPSEFENNMNVYGVGNMCCTVDLKVADTVGEANLAEFCASARQQGMRIEMWGNTSLSTLVDICSRRDKKQRIDFLPMEGSALPRISEDGDPWIRNLSGAIEADHYTPVFACMNLRKSAVRDYWLEKWGYAHTNVGLEGIFVDSAFNLSADKFHYLQNAEGYGHGATIDQTQLLGATRPAKAPRQVVLSQYGAFYSLMVEMQKIGYSICLEDVGLFGISRSGPDVTMRWKSLPMWVETLCNFDRRSIKRMGEDPDDVYFAGLAYRVMWYHYWNPRREAVTFFQDGPRDAYDRPNAFHIALLKAFGEVGPLMVNRHISEDETWVRYEKDGQICYWAFKDSTVTLDKESQVRDLIDATTTRSTALTMKRHHVYVVSA